MRAILVVTALCLAFDASAEDACKGIELKAGKVVTGLVLSPFSVDKPAQQACIDLIAKTLVARRQLLSATVTVRVPDRLRLDGKALDGAKKTHAALIAAGVPEVRLSVVAPRAEADEPPIILVLYTDRPVRPIARVDLVEGSASWAEEGGTQQPLKAGDFLEQGSIIRMKGAPSFRMSLADGSTFVLEPDAIVRLVTLEASKEKAVTVELELIVGAMSVVTAAQAKGSSFRVVAGDARVTFEKASARLRRKEGGLVVEVLKGTASASARDSVQALAEGQGTRILADGTVEPARALLAGPRITAPLMGEVKPSAKLLFDAVEGAASYRIEFAQDAAFSHDPTSTTDTDTSARIPGKLKKGKWFWRVIPVDKDGLQGQSSRIHAFTR